ncbi:hypothetical protein [Undibacterium sp. Ji49W]|uniref:hypothetical protein n=1 Tax=Undibacterium sp. Ji49W TaxID=3413040 RepID=UPI003BF417B4
MFAKKILGCLIVASLNLMPSSASLAQTKATDPALKQAREYYKAGDVARLDKRYADALQLLLKAYELIPDSSDLPYDIACLHALRGAKDDAFK